MRAQSHEKKTNTGNVSTATTERVTMKTECGIYQSLFTNTLVEHTYTNMHKLKNKHGLKTYNNAISAQCECIIK